MPDFEQDNKWKAYLNFCDYFCFAIPKSDEKLRELVELSIFDFVGILLVDLDAEPDNDLNFVV